MTPERGLAIYFAAWIGFVFVMIYMAYLMLAFIVFMRRYALVERLSIHEMDFFPEFGLRAVLCFLSVLVIDAGWYSLSVEVGFLSFLGGLGFIVGWQVFFWAIGVELNVLGNVSEHSDGSLFLVRAIVRIKRLYLMLRNSSRNDLRREIMPLDSDLDDDGHRDDGYSSGRYPSGRYPS
jgi:hypothetical protein